MGARWAGRCNCIHGNKPGGLSTRSKCTPGDSSAAISNHASLPHQDRLPPHPGFSSAFLPAWLPPLPAFVSLPGCRLCPGSAGAHAARAPSLPPPGAGGAARGLGLGCHGAGPPWPLKRTAATCWGVDVAAPGLPGSWGHRTGDLARVRGRVGGAGEPPVWSFLLCSANPCYYCAPLPASPTPEPGKPDVCCGCSACLSCAFAFCSLVLGFLSFFFPSSF